VICDTPNEEEESTVVACLRTKYIFRIAREVAEMENQERERESEREREIDRERERGVK
jgi:hypothetical protein